MATKSSTRFGWLLLAVLVGASPCCPGRTLDKNSVLTAPVDENTAVRFFYQPPEDHFHFPMVFRPVPEKDPRLNTAPMTEAGRTAYVSFPEMQQMLNALAKSGLAWQESEKVETLGSYTKLIHENGAVTVVTSRGTAKAGFDPKRICKILTPLESALTTPRALWEFQAFRLNYGCKVPGFKYDAYPDRE